jgi:hypothetical protein
LQFFLYSCTDLLGWILWLFKKVNAQCSLFLFGKKLLPLLMSNFEPAWQDLVRKVNCHMSIHIVYSINKSQYSVIFMNIKQNTPYSRHSTFDIGVKCFHYKFTIAKC